MVHILLPEYNWPALVFASIQFINVLLRFSFYIISRFVPPFVQSLYSMLMLPQPQSSQQDFIFSTLINGFIAGCDF